MFLQSIKHGGPYQVLAVCKYAIVPTTIEKNLFENLLKLVLVIYLITPPTFRVYRCY